MNSEQVESLKELQEVKHINPRNREEVYLIDLKTGEVFTRNLEKIGRATLNKRTKVLTVRTVYTEKIKLEIETGKSSKIFKNVKG